MKIENTIIVTGVKEVIDNPELILFGVFMLALMAGVGSLFGAAVAPVGVILVYGVYGVFELIFALITYPFTKLNRKSCLAPARVLHNHGDWGDIDGDLNEEIYQSTSKSNLPKNYDFDRLLED